MIHTAVTVLLLNFEIVRMLVTEHHLPTDARLRHQEHIHL